MYIAVVGNLYYIPQQKRSAGLKPPKNAEF